MELGKQNLALKSRYGEAKTQLYQSETLRTGEQLESSIDTVTVADVDT